MSKWGLKTMIHFTSTFLFLPFITQGNGYKRNLFKDNAILEAGRRQKGDRSNKCENNPWQFPIYGTGMHPSKHTKHQNFIYVHLTKVHQDLPLLYPCWCKLSACLCMKERERQTETLVMHCALDTGFAVNIWQNILSQVYFTMYFNDLKSTFSRWESLGHSGTRYY